ncbi:MAG TPA: acyl-CoA dehydrogenase [Gammaproteobacteria bacterium]|nr:acyl-CoA dehydrogenase [Gammaproteobacteria bacterium]
MDLSYPEKYKAFRQEVIDFLKQNANLAPTADFRLHRPDQKWLDWQALLIEKGYTARTVPKQYGGYGAEPDILAESILTEEFSRAGVSQGLDNQGTSMLVPTLLEVGTEAQRQQWVPGTIRGEIIWAQGYSEPSAGSDLASLKTHARVEDGHFIINGQKIWTSSAQFADMIFILVRTEPDAPKHKGISYLLMPMDLPGIDIRPLVTMTGDATFNEVFLTDVKLPVDQIVGKRGDGWQVANVTLKYERGKLGNPREAQQRFERLVDLMQQETINGTPLMENAVLRDRLLRLQGRILAMTYNGQRVLSSDLKGENPGLAGMLIKLNGTWLNHELAGLAIDVLGELGILYDNSPYENEGDWQRKYMFDLGLMIGGGSTQIQKNIIAERALGMPKEPKYAPGDFPIGGGN